MCLSIAAFESPTFAIGSRGAPRRSELVHNSSSNFRLKSRRRCMCAQKRYARDFCAASLLPPAPPRAALQPASSPGRHPLPRGTGTVRCKARGRREPRASEGKKNEGLVHSLGKSLT